MRDSFRSIAKYQAKRKCKRNAIVVGFLLLAFLLCAGSIPATMVSIVVISVFAEDEQTNEPIADLTNQDFEVFKDGVRSPNIIFRRDPTPAAILFVVGCPEQAQANLLPLSGALGKAFAELNPDDTVAVAHWCSDSGVGIDLRPTKDREAPVATIEAILHRVPVVPSAGSADRGLQAALDRIFNSPQDGDWRLLPSIVLLHSRRLALPQAEADLIAKKLLYHVTILYDIETENEQRATSHPSLELAARTGGRAFSVRRDEYSQAVRSIFTALHSRYVLAIHAGPADRKWHELRVQLSDDVRQKYPKAHLDFAAGYLAVHSFDSSPPYFITSRHGEKENIDVLRPFLKENSAQHKDIQLEAKPQGFYGSDQLFEFGCSISGDGLTWENLPDGNRRTQVSIIFDSYSAKGAALAREVVKLEVIRDELNMAITGDGPFAHSERIIAPEGSSLVRITVRDDATGRNGSQDFSMAELLAAPKAPAVIR